MKYVFLSGEKGIESLIYVECTSKNIDQQLIYYNDMSQDM